MDADYLIEQNTFLGSCFLTFSLIGCDVLEHNNSRPMSESNDILKKMNLNSFV